MRVTILSRDFPPAPSGIGDHTDRMAAELAARGHAVSVVCSPPGAERAAFDVHAIVGGWQRADVARLARVVGETKPDVIIWQYNPFSVGRRGLAGSAASLARALRAVAPLVTFAHELWFPWGREGLRGLAWALAQRRATRAVLRASAGVIVTTELRAQAVRRHARRVARIPVGSNVDVAAYSARASLGIPADAFVIGHVGGLGPGKEPGPVWAALERLRDEGIDARLLLAGRGRTGQPPARVRDAVVVTGEVADLSPLLYACDVYVHPDPAGPAVGRRTALCAVLAHGVPLVAFRGPDHAGELEDGRNVVLTDPTGRALSAALRGLHADPQRRAKLAQAARETSEASFAWRKIGDEIEVLLVELSR